MFRGSEIPGFHNRNCYDNHSTTAFVGFRAKISLWFCMDSE